jgi:hypothetical protein
VKEQCRNCTFLNGQFAEECEMCGEPLSHAFKTNKSHHDKEKSSSSHSHSHHHRDRKDFY